MNLSVIVAKALRNKAWGPMILQCRGSQYPASYAEPIYRLEELDKLYENKLAEEKAFIPVKAAKSDENTSVFRDELLNKFINMVLKKGKKSLARSLVEKGLENVKCIQIEKYHKAPPEEKDNIECNPLKIFHQALINCKPVLALTPVKRGAHIYQVPVPIMDSRSRFMAMRWIIEAAKDKQRKIHFPEKLAWELLDAYKNEGSVVRRKQDLHKQCEANKAFAHYRWGG